jgi:uncharacterized membrane protein YdjX (TVP38/TMEM64 family)
MTGLKAHPLLARFAPILIILAVLALALALGLHRYLSVDALRDRRAELEAFVSANLVVAVLIYMLVYAAATAISLPGGLILTLTGGFLFGPWIGGGATLRAATVGGTTLFLACRTAIGGFLRERAGGWFRRLEDGFQRNAFSYLLTLRLIPWAPFWVVNLVPAFLGVKLRDFLVATVLGIIPATFIYASVGNGLRAALDAGTATEPVAAIRRLIWSPEFLLPIAGLIALSLLPILVRALRGQRGGTDA